MISVLKELSKRQLAIILLELFRVEIDEDKYSKLDIISIILNESNVNYNSIRSAERFKQHIKEFLKI